MWRVTASTMIKALVCAAEAAVIPFVNSDPKNFTSAEWTQVGAMGATAAIGFAAWLDPAASIQAVVAEGDRFSNLGTTAMKSGATVVGVMTAYSLLEETLLFIITPLELFNGFGAPNAGGQFNDGHTVFHGGISDILNSADASTDLWAGGGADKYNTQNSYQETRVAKIAEADHDMAGYVKWQADKVEEGRQIMAGARLALAGALVVASAMLKTYFYWSAQSANPISAAKATSVGNALIRFVELSIIAVCLEALSMIGVLIGESVHTEKAVHRRISDCYDWVVNNVRDLTPLAAAHGGTAEAAAMPAPDFSGVAIQVGDAMDNVEATGQRGDSLARVSVGGLTPTVTPILEAVSQAPAQAAALSTQAAPYMYVANQAQGQVQQVSAQAHQLAGQSSQPQAPQASGKDGAKLADEDAVAEGADDGAAGTEAGAQAAPQLAVGAAPAVSAAQRHDPALAQGVAFD